MSNKIYDAFATINAQSELKSTAQSFLAQKLYCHKKRGFAIKQLAYAMACFTALIFCGMGYIYLTPVAAISIDVNPSIELNINKFERVISIDGYNEDGENLAPSLGVLHLPYIKAIEKILDKENMLTFIENGEQISVTIACASQEKNEQMLTALAQTATRKNVTCHAVNTQEVANAHGHGLSFGKYSAYLALYELDNTVTIEQIKTLTMRQINDKISELTGTENKHQGKGKNRYGQGHGENNCFKNNTCTD